MSKHLEKIHVLKNKVFGKDDAAYRVMLENLTEKKSAKDLTVPEQLKVINHLQSLIDKKPSLVNADKKTLLAEIASLTKGKHKNYVKAIADKMHKKPLLECNEAELLQIVDALRKKR